MDARLNSRKLCVSDERDDDPIVQRVIPAKAARGKFPVGVPNSVFALGAQDSPQEEPKAPARAFRCAIYSDRTLVLELGNQVMHLDADQTAEFLRYLDLVRGAGVTDRQEGAACALTH